MYVHRQIVAAKGIVTSILKAAAALGAAYKLQIILYFILK